MVRGVLLLVLCWQVEALAQQMDWTPPDPPKVPRLASALADRLDAARAKPVAGTQPAAAERVTVLLEPEAGREADAIDRAALARAGARVVDASRHLLEASVALADLEAVSQVAGVGFVGVAEPPAMWEVISEGVADIGAATAQANGITGSGAKVAVIDYAFAEVTALKGTELPANTWYVDLTGTGIDSGSEPHGTACAEIIHDVAPEAELHLYKVANLLQFENAVARCLSDGIHIASFSGGWLGTGVGDGQGLACDIVNRAADGGVLWVNAAGNLAQRQYTGTSADADGDGWHEFAPGVEKLYLQDTQVVGSLIRLCLTWDEWPTTFEDWDLYLGREAPDGSVVMDLATSRTAQTGTAPVEYITHQITGSGRYFAAIRRSRTTSATTLKLASYYHSFANNADVFGTLSEPADARGAFAVGAVAQYVWPQAQIESYSSRGPTTDGRTKPEIVAPTWVSTATYGAGTFAGTSAATPHVAGVAALIKSIHPGYTGAQLADALAAAAVDVGTAGKDNTFGYGLLTAPAPYTVSGVVTLAGQALHSGVTVTFSRLSGSGAVPGAVPTNASGAWSASGFDPGSVYLATPGRTGWTFAPSSAQFSAATSALAFVGQPATFAASGQVTLAGQADHSGVAISFSRLSGTGATPPAVQTSSTGAWSASGFGAGSVYLAIPSRPGWTFAPAAAQFGQAATILDFVGQQTSYGASGRVTLSGQADHSGVTITFARLYGTGALPAAVSSGADGSWSASGFEPGTVYLATPYRSGWTFAPPSTQFGQATSTLDFVGQAPPYGVAGQALLAGQADHSGTTIAFARVSGTGPIPAAVQTNAAGAWSADGFTPGTVYLGTPSHPGWVFNPQATSFSGPGTTLDFAGQPPPFAVSGVARLAGQSDHSGTTIAFVRVSGTGAIPAAVQTNAAGAWSADGFTPGTAYLASPSRTGWVFAPQVAPFNGPATTLDFAGTMPPIGLLVRAVVGSSRLASPAQIVIGRRAVIEVQKYARPDRGDSTTITAFSLQVPAALGAATANAVRLTTVAGTTGAVAVTAEGLTEQLQITTLPGTLDHLVLEPEAVSLAAGEQVDFAAVGADAYGNQFPLTGSNVAWHCVPTTIGAITPAGLFTAGSSGSQGYVVAVASSGLRFGDARASSGTGRVLVREAVPATFALHQNTPNPFNPETTFRFDLAVGSQVRLEVYDSAGRRVRRLVDQPLPAGSHAVRWDGRAEDGAALGSGLYLARLTAGQAVSVRKALLVR